MFDINTYVTIAQNDGIDKAEEYRLSNTPTHLFRFMSVNKRNIKKILENKVWASHYSTLNDPFEFKSIYVDEDKISQPGNSIEAFQKYFDYIRNGFLVVSFSAEGYFHPLNNMPMWAYYGNNHKGICIEYEVVDPAYLHPVIYEEAPRLKIASILATAAAKGKIHPDNADLKLYNFLILNSLCRKHKSWQHENEYRALFPDFDNVFKGKDILLSQIGVKIKAIYLGRNCSNQNKYNLYRAAQELGIDIFQMDIKAKCNDFEMEFTPYTTTGREN